jgi:hypothetical protein
MFEDTVPSWHLRRDHHRWADVHRREKRQDFALVTAAGVAIGLGGGGLLIALMGWLGVAVLMFVASAILATGVIVLDAWENRR